MVASRRRPYIYVQNWKCGSSTVRHTLWTAEHALGTAVPPGVPHVPAAEEPFINDPRRWEHARREFVFTIARNPYVRVLSAYLDKVVAHRHCEWAKFAARHQLGDAPLSFGEFLRLVSLTPAEEMDPHWRPQSCTLAPRIIPYDFIGSLEHFDEDMRYVLDRIFGKDVAVATNRPHRTDSSERLGSITGARRSSSFSGSTRTTSLLSATVWTRCTLAESPFRRARTDG